MSRQDVFEAGLCAVFLMTVLVGILGSAASALGTVIAGAVIAAILTVIWVEIPEDRGDVEASWPFGLAAAMVLGLIWAAVIPVGAA